MFFRALVVQPTGISSHLLYIIQSISAAANTSCALVIIDVLVEVMKKCAVDVLNNCSLIEGLFDYVCKMRSDVAVSLIRNSCYRCLLPIINNRIQLRDALFKSLKKDLLGNSTVNSAVPILLLLLRSVSQRKAGITHCNISQSFATFSSQSLADMGLKRTIDKSIGLEIVGILKRCLSQPSSTRTFPQSHLMNVLVHRPIRRCTQNCPFFTVIQLARSSTTLLCIILFLVTQEIHDSLPEALEDIGNLLHRVAGSWVVDCDRLIILMKRRRELNDVLVEKTIKKKETKVTEALTVDIHQGDVVTSAFTISQILNRIIPKNATSIHGLDEVKSDLLSWAIDRVHTLSQMILQTYHPLHSIISGTQNLISVASSLLNFYVGIDCVEWICSIDTPNQCKTKALEAYANIVYYLSTKYKHQPMRVVQIWQHGDSNITQSSAGQLSANGSLVRHCHLVLTKLYPALLVLDRKDGEEKKTAVELEKQAKAMIKIVSSLMALNYNPKGWNTAFKFVMKMLEVNTFALKCDDVDGAVEKTLKTLADEVVQVLSDEKTLSSIRLAVAFAADFFVRDQRCMNMMFLAFYYFSFNLVKNFKCSRIVYIYIYISDMQNRGVMKQFTLSTYEPENLFKVNNSIGMRDFRIDMRILKDNMTRIDEEEPPGRKRRRKGNVDKPNEVENLANKDDDENSRNISNHRTFMNSEYTREGIENEMSIVY
uniref:FANCI_HD2 domain-containing protein n=1 Tax=Heterorhabditis bacteriophora TaxID=37862 RepID=A0A1I7WS53_HETBA